MTHTNATRQATARPPAQKDVDMLINRLKSDPDFVITVMVNNAYRAVLERYKIATGTTTNLSKAALAAKIQAMRKGDGPAARRIISVPLELPHNTALEVAYSSMRSEFAARYDNGIMAKMAPSNSMKEEGDDAPDSDFWASLPGVLTGLGGLVGAFTGNTPSGGNTQHPAPSTQPSTSLLRVLGMVLIAVAVIGGTVLLIRAVRK